MGDRQQSAIHRTRLWLSAVHRSQRRNEPACTGLETAFSQPGWDRAGFVPGKACVLLPGIPNAKVKTYIAQVIKTKAINIFEIDEHLIEFSDTLKEKLTPDFAGYGLSLERFFVTAIAKPDGEAQYEKFKELHFRQYADIAEAKLQQQTAIIYAQTEAQKTVIDSQAIATKRVQEGYTYQQERGFDVAEKAAENEAAGQFTGMGIGLGAMAGVGGAVGGVVGEAVQGAFGTPYAQSVSAGFCENCGAPLQSSMAFCGECGAPVAAKPACSKCGYVFERPGKFCPKCGTKREVV